MVSREDKRSAHVVVAGVLIAAVALFVTAAVTSAYSQPAGEFRVVITNLQTGKHAYYKPTWPDQARCDAALANLNDMLAKMRDPDPNVKVPDYNGPDEKLNQTIFMLALNMFQNTGIVPQLSVSCELKGDPV